MKFSFAAYSIDTELLQLTASKKPVALQPQALALLVFLIQNCERVVTKDEIINAVWDGRAVSDATLNTRINALRRALGDSGATQTVIKTYPRRGFRFIAPLENGSTPSAATSSTTHDHNSNTATGGATKPSIAILPFANVSEDPEQEFFADGITDDLVTSMSRLRGIFVSGRNSTLTYKNAQADARTVAAELGVRYVLEGSVRTAGNRVRVSVWLTAGSSGEQLWAERYDRDMGDVFAIQDEITENIVGQLAPEIYSAENARFQRVPPQNLDAWECFVRAMHLYGQQSKQSSADALELLEQAITLDPGYAQALGLYALTLAWRAIQRLEEFETAIEKASALAERAIAADANDAWAHLGHGMAAMVARNHGKASAGFEKAVELSPNFAYAHAMHGAANAYGGKPDAAIQSIDTAIKLSPRDTFLDKFHIYYSLAHFQAGNYERAAEAADRALHLKPEHPNSHMLAASANAHAGNMERAKQALAMFRKLVPGTNAANVERAIAYEHPADRERLADGLRMAGLEG